MIFKGNSGGLEPTNFFKPVASLFSQTAGLNDKQKEFYNDLTEAYKQNKKQADLLSDALEKLKEKYKGADLGISSYINSVGDGTITAEGFTESINNNTRAMLKNKIMAATLNIGLSILASVLVNVLVTAIQAEEKSIERATDATKKFADATKTVTDSFKQYDELYKVLSDSASTTEELNDAKSRLLDLQNQLTETYGKEAQGIDLVNGKYEEQIGLLEEVRKSEIEKYLRENRNDLEVLAKKMNENFQFSLGNSGTKRYSDEFSAALKNLYESNDSITLYDDGFGNINGQFSTDVKDAYDALSTLYDQFSDLRDIATNDVERTFIDSTLDSISRKISEWNEKYADKAEAYNNYSSAVMYGVPNLTSEDGNTVSVSRMYDKYVKAVEEYNKALSDGTREEIDVATANLESARASAEGVIDLASASGDLTTEQAQAIADGFANITNNIDNALAKRQELKYALQDLADEDISTSNSITNDDGKILLNDRVVTRIKSLKMSMTEFNALLNSDDGKLYFAAIDSVATQFGVTIEDVLELLAQLGLFADLESPISDNDIATFEKYRDLLYDVAYGKTDYASLTDEEKEAIKRWTEAADARNVSLLTYLKLCREAGDLKIADTASELNTAYTNLSSATDDVTKALEDIDTIVDVVNGDMHLTDKQAADLISRHEDLRDAINYTTDGWTLESSAMEVLENASNSLEVAYLSAQNAMSEALSGQAKIRLENLGIELEGIQSVAEAYAIIAKANGQTGPRKIETATSIGSPGSVSITEMMGAVNNTATGNKLTQAEQNAIVSYAKIVEQLKEGKDRLTSAISKLGSIDKGSSSSKSGSSVEKYIVDVDELYKVLEKQKEIEEDIADIQRKRNALDDDQYSEKIKYIYQEIDTLNELNGVLHEQNEIRRAAIRASIEDLRKYGFQISYNASYNELIVKNYEDLNSIATTYAKNLGYGTEKTNDFVKSVEDMISAIHDLNDENKDNSASWQDNTQAVKDYLKEIKKLKTEMVDAYLDKRNNYLSHMQDFELFNDFQSSDYLNGMLHDLEDFYNAGLLDYEEYVERHNEITKQLYDSRKESLEYVLDMVENMIKQELDDQVDALEDQKDALNDIIDMKKELISLAKEENDYNKSLKDKVKEMAKLQERIAQLELDDSREAAAEKASLIDQLADLQSEVDDMQMDHSIDRQQEALDEMADNHGDMIDEEIEQLEDLAKNSEYIHNQTIQYIRDNWESLLSDLIEYNNTYGDGIDENVTQNWENAYSALLKYKEEAWSVAKDMTTGQAVIGTLNPLLPDNSGSAGSVIADAQVVELVRQMKQNSLEWPNAGARRGELERENENLAAQIEALTGQPVTRDNNGVWWIGNDKLYEKFHGGGTVGAKKDSEVFSLLEKGEDVLTKKQKFTAIPVLKAGLQALNINENTAKILEALQSGARPSFAAMNNPDPSVVFSPEINIKVNAGNNSKEIAAATKDAVWSAITEPFSKMGVSSKLRSIKV